MKSIVNGFIIAISMYSKLPMPKAERNRQNMKYTLCFFPVVGLVIGVLLYAWSEVCVTFGFGQVCFMLVGAVIPVIIPGCIHLVGFMDTIDAMHSSAFAVIASICFFLLYGAGLTLILKESQLLLLGLGFIISRTLSGMSLVWFPSAKKEGTLYTLSSTAHKKTVKIVLATILAMCFVSAVLIQPVIGAVMSLAAMWVWTYYYYMSKKQFGGITDDLTGYFLCLCELSSVLVVGCIGRIM